MEVEHKEGFSHLLRGQQQAQQYLQFLLLHVTTLLLVLLLRPLMHPQPRYLVVYLGQDLIVPILELLIFDLIQFDLVIKLAFYQYQQMQDLLIRPAVIPEMVLP